MLKALPKSWFSSSYFIYEDKAAIAEIDLAFFTESSDMQIKGETYKAYREGLLSGAFLLESINITIARAIKPDALSRSFQVEYGDRKYTLEAESAFLRKFLLFEGVNIVGSIYPEHAFTGRATIDLPEDIPLAVRVFMFWLVAILWKRDSDSAVVAT